MWLWRQITIGMRSLLHREGSERDLADEVQHYLEQARDDLVRGGASPAEASRAVRLRYGDSLGIREDVRAYGWETAVEELYSDLRLTARRLRRSPGFTMVVTLILGLGIGATTAIISAVRPVLFDPLPYPDADRILALSDRGESGATIPVTFGTYRELSERSRAFEAFAVFKSWQPTLTGGEEPERLEGQRVSASYFDILGVAPALGTGFDTSADRPGGRNEVVLSHALWQRRFASDPAVLGQLVDFDGEPFVIVGVMPRGFEDVPSLVSQVWALMQYDPLVTGFDTREWGHHLGLVGRLRAGVALDDARRELSLIAEQPIAGFERPDWASLAQGLTVRRLRDAATAGARPTMLALLGAVGLLLAIACVNLTTLLLARGLRRRGELAMRAALGAGRGRLVRQMLTESLALAALGGVLGVLVAQIGLSALVAVSPATLFPNGSIGLDGATLALAFGLTTLVGVVVGLAPALSQSEESATDALHDAGRKTTGSNGLLPRALVVTEVAFALMLLIGAGLLVRSTERLFSTPVGLDPTGIMVMQVHTTSLEPGDDATHRFWNQALEAVRSVPGVESAGLTSQLPLSGDVDVYGVAFDDEIAREGSQAPAYRYAVTPGYLETLGIRRIRGRTLEAQDDLPGAPRVAVVSESLARRLFQDRDPIGQRLRFGPFELPPFTIVGVVDDVKQESLAAEQADGMYIPSQRWHWADRVRWIVLRVEGDPGVVVPAVRRAVWSVNSNQPIVRAQSMEDIVLRSEAQRRFVMIVLMAFALFALILAGLGIYGVLSGSVSERMQEIGLRSALGASHNNILALVIRRGMALTAVGVPIGLLGAAAASEILSTLLFDVGRLDPVTYLAASALIATVSVTACWLPARRAASVDALTTLKAE